MRVKNVRKYIIGIICVAMLCLICFGIVRKQTKEIYDSASKAMVYIINEEQGGNGSVYKIEDDRLVIVTTYHLLQDSERVTVYFPNQTYAEGSTIGVNEEHDVGFVEVGIAQVPEEALKQIASVQYDEAAYNELKSGDYMEYRYLEWNGGHVSATSRKGSIGHMNWYIEDFDDYFIYNYCDVKPGMSGCAAVAEDGSYIGMMIGGASNESGALSAHIIEKIYAEID